jgi:menaquinone-dependent protoporphyrinogen oxidase
MTPRILVAYATKHGSTREVAHVVAEELRLRGLCVDVAPAEQVGSVTDYDGVVMGGALYMGRWHPQATHLLTAERDALASMPVAVFAMGPRTMDPSEVAQSRRQLDRALEKAPSVRPCAVAIFGGVVEPRTLRFPLNRMPASDARDWDAVRSWTAGLTRFFGYGKPASGPGDDRTALQQTPR